MLLSVDFAGVPFWTEQGPGPIEVSSIGTAGGAIESIAVHPSQPIAFVGAANGGIWRTMDITASPPDWEPLGDQLESLSIRSVAFDPIDATGNTIYAGSGRSSAGFGDGGDHVGIFLSTDLGTTWTQLARTDLLGQSVRKIIPTGFLDPMSNQEVILVASANANGGVFRSDDAGVSFTRISGDGVAGNFLPNAGVTSLVADPAVPGRYYAGVPQSGVFRSNDYGVHWVNMSNGITDNTANTISIDLAVHNSPGNDVVYAAITRNDQPLPAPFNNRTNRMSSLFRSTDGAQNWRQVQNMLVVNPGAQGGLHFGMAAHPTNANVVFVFGDAPVPDDGPGGLNPFGSAYMSRYQVTMDDITPANDAWVPIADFGANGTRPHADARDIAFQANGDLIEVDDGGIYRLLNPDNAARVWEPINGNLRAAEFFSVAYDSLNNTLFGGAQDNGTSRQRDPSDPLYPFFWTVAQGADGGVAGVDNDQNAHPNETRIYTVSQNLGSFTRRTIDQNNMETGSTPIGTVASTNGNDIRGVETAVVNPNMTRGTLRYMTPYVVNNVAPSQLIVGTNFLYESTDSGDTFTALGGLTDLNGDGQDNDQDAGSMAAFPPLHGTDETDEFLPLNPIGQVNGIDPARPLSNPIAYGGTADGMVNSQVLWVGGGGNLLLRTAGNGLPTVVANYTTAPVNGGAVIDVVMDPEDWRVAYILDSNGTVFRAVSNNAGTNVVFTDVTGNLGDVATSLRVLEAVRIDGNLVLLVGGRLGVYRALNPSADAVWTELGANLANAPVNDIRYDATDDLLLAGTFGRGAWTIDKASFFLLQNPVLNVCGDENQVNQDDTFRLQRNAGNPLLLDVFINGVLEFTGPIAAIQQINVFGIGGNDNLIVDSTNGLINVPTGIRYDGDGACPDPDQFFGGEGFGYDRGVDRLTLEQTNGPTHVSDSIAVGASAGTGVSTIVGVGGTQTVYFEELEPIVDGVPAASLTIDGGTVGTLMNEDNAINYEVSDLFGPTWGKVTIDAFEPIHFTNKTTLIIDAENGRDEINLNNPNTPTGLTGDCDAVAAGTTPICIIGDDPTASDRLIVNGTPGADTINFFPTAADAGRITGAGPVAIRATAIELLTINAQGGDDDLTVTTPSSTDVVNFFPQAQPSSGSVRVQRISGAGDAALLAMDFTNLDVRLGTLILADAGAIRADSVVVHGRDLASEGEFFVVDGGGAGGAGTVSLNARGATTITLAPLIATPSAQTLELKGLAGDDRFLIFGPLPYNQTGVDGGEPDSGDVIDINGPAGDVTISLAPPEFVQQVTGYGGTAFRFFGVEFFNPNVGGMALTIEGTADADVLNYTPTGTSAGTVTRDGQNLVINFTLASGVFTLNGGGNTADEAVIHGTNIRDTITINANNRTTNTVQVNALKAVALPTTTEVVRARGRDGNDTFVVNPAPGAGGSLDNLLIYVDGGEPGASDALVVQDPDLTPLDATDFAVVNRRRQPDEGVVRVFRDSPGAGNEPVQLPDISYTDVEVVSPNVFVNGAGDPNLLILGPDLNEPNEFRANAAFLGSGPGAPGQILHASVFPNANEHPFVPADTDFYRVVAEVTGTLDFQVYFRLVPELLPGAADIDIDVRDADGTIIAGAGVFGTNDFNNDERIRIPAVAGQTYYLRVYGGTGNAVNGYDVTVVNTPPPVPFDLELDDFPVIVPASPGDACPAIIAGGASNNSDTGRSQFDNVTCDSTPTIRFRLNDGIFLHDLPGNAANDTPPDEVIVIPFQAGAGVASYRLAIFDEGTPQQPGGLPQVPVGFATQVAEGVYEFTFPTALTDGSHFIWARVQMVDPATPQQTGFGANSQSLEIVVDTIDPLVSFGDSSTANDDGLAASSDTGVVGQPATFTDNVTSDTTPTFWGTAEANSVIRVFADTLGGATIQICETVAVPNDGTNQFPNGEWTCTSNVDLNDPVIGFAFDGVRLVSVQAEDLAGNISGPVRIEIFIDTRGPQVTGVLFDPIDPALPEESVFGIKPLQANAPTPLTRTIVINALDLPARAIGAGAIPGGPFLYGALNSIVAVTLGQYVLTGDQNGVIAISSIVVINNVVVDGQVPTARVELNFNTPLPDDRYTLTVSDAIVDDAGNSLDGQSNSQEPLDVPSFPTGDGQPGGNYVARFTVDSRPEIGTFCCGSWYIDLNGNGSFDDPNNHDTDFTNSDIVYKFGLPGDFPVVGDWDGNGFDEIGVYGRRADGFRFELDLNGNGAFDAGDASFLYNASGPGAGGRPVAGVWNQNQIIAGKRCDHVAVFNGTTWFADFSLPCYTPASSPPATTIVTAARGRPIAADFNGDGDDDAGLYRNNVFTLDFASDDDFLVETSITFGFNTNGQIPVAADWDADRDGNVGLWVADRNGQFPHEAAEWYLDLGQPFTGPLSGPISAIFGGPGAQPANPGDGLFQPPPTGGLPTMPNLPFVFQDIFAQFGDQLAEPVVGNFDPPRGDSPVSGINRPLLRLDDSSNVGPGATPVIVWESGGDASESATIGSTTDRDVFQLRATESGRVAIVAAKDGSTVDTYLTVYSSSGRRLARNANYGGTTNSRVEIDVVAGQTYYIAVTSSRRTVGDYQMLVDYLFADDTGAGAAEDHGNSTGAASQVTIESGPVRVAGRVDYANDLDFFVFTPTTSRRLDIAARAIAGGVDTVLSLYDSTGRVLAQNDNARRGTTDSGVSFDVEANATYYIRVRGQNGSRGEYELTVDSILDGVV